MNPQAARKYLQTKVLTATAEQLQMMLFDGCISACEQGRVALQKKDYERSFQALSKAQAIVNQLLCSLKPDISPDLCKKLKGLYTFAYRRLVDANLHHRIDALDEAMKVLKYQRETWAMLMEKLGREKAAVAAKRLDIPAPDARMEASISMQG
jgi:flagellar secretion chaperone FliS